LTNSVEQNIKKQCAYYNLRKLEQLDPTKAAGPVAATKV